MATGDSSPAPICKRNGKREKKAAAKANSMSKRTKEPASVVRRPKNCGILYRMSDKQELKKAGAHMDDGEMDEQLQLCTCIERLSDLHSAATKISGEWRSMRADDKHHLKDLAKQEEPRHEEAYPKYKYQPCRREEIKERSGNKNKTSGAAKHLAGDAIAFPDSTPDLEKTTQEKEEDVEPAKPPSQPPRSLRPPDPSQLTGDNQVGENELFKNSQLSRVTGSSWATHSYGA
ncbi:hypothetical protein DL767_004807 [Monosporascus sp. MG133]|nr:hypothetical protein DL767_004807 [Monosporascus sp. MG133]